MTGQTMVDFVNRSARLDGMTVYNLEPYLPMQDCPLCGQPVSIFFWEHKMSGAPRSMLGSNAGFGGGSGATVPLCAMRQPGKCSNLEFQHEGRPSCVIEFDCREVGAGTVTINNLAELLRRSAQRRLDARK